MGIYKRKILRKKRKKTRSSVHFPYIVLIFCVRKVVILGTGLVESIVAAAAARLGHTVLHIDTAGWPRWVHDLIT